MKAEDIEVTDLAHGEGPWEELDREDDGGRRWTKGTTTVCRHKENGELWAVDWECGLTECQENIYDGTPYRMESYEETIPARPARKVRRYRKAA